MTAMQHATVKLLGAVAFTITAIFAAEAAEITAEQTAKQKRNFSYISIVGPIKSGDAHTFRTVWREAGPDISVVRLQSPGGDLIEAMKIGRMVRQGLLLVSVPQDIRVNHVAHFRRCYAASNPFPLEDVSPNCTCASACFFIFVAGIGRNGDVLGIHRPRFEKRYFAGLNIHQAEAKYNEMLETARKYLYEMDVPNEYYERMISISSQEIEYLREDEIENHFTGLLPAYDEWIIAKCGPKLTESELTTWTEESAKEQFDGNGDEALIRRLSKVHDDYFQCYYPIMKAAQRARYMEIFPRQ